MRDKDSLPFSVIVFLGHFTHGTEDDDINDDLYSVQ
jgi:hypothetical protein